MFRESVFKFDVFNAILRRSRLYSSKKFEIKNKFRFAEQNDASSDEPKSSFVERISTPYESTGRTNYRPKYQSDDRDAVSSSPYPSDDLLKVAQQRKYSLEHLMKTDASNVILTDNQRPNSSNLRFLKRISKYAPQKQTPEVEGEILFGIHPVLIALQAQRRRIYTIYVKSTRSMDDRTVEIQNLAKERSVNLKYVTVSTLSNLSGQRVHQGICADVSPLEPSPYFQSTCKSEDLDAKPPVWLLLYNITDPMNFGAILRSSYFFGINRVLCTRNSSCVLSPVVSKASSGSLEVTDISTVDDVPSFIEQHKRMGWFFVGTFGDGQQTVDVNSFSISKPTVILMGSEGFGLGTDVLSLCDIVVDIKPGKKLNPLINSLNVSAAASVILHRLLSKE